MGKIRAMSLFYKSIDNQVNKINAEHMTHNQVVTGSSPVGPGEGGGANGLTLTATWKYPDGTISRTDSRVAIASDAINKWGRVYTDSRNASVHHEIGGHVYEDAFNPSLTESQRNRNTEKFEQLVRDIEINMSPIGGRAVKH